MLPRKNRIKKKKEFDEIFKKGRSFKVGLLILKTLKNRLGYDRFAFIVSAKVSPRAVVRNKLRRRMSEIVSATLKNKNSGEDFIFLALPGIEAKGFEELKNIIGNLLKKTQNV